MLQTIIDQASALSVIESLAVVLAIAYLLLAIRQSVWCWPCAAISTTCYVYLFFDARLYMESVLNVFYLGMAFYGWYSWQFPQGSRDQLPVQKYPARIHGFAMVTIIILAAITGYVLASYSQAAYPYVDSLTTWGAIWTTFLVARKVLENWWYWLAIDAVSVLIYWDRGLQLTSVLFIVYLLMIPFGLASWTKSYRSQAAA
ncbi:MAG: nicotinamide mononucleotide transporter [Woeseia sp.]|nr:nicotinamide riboside transporter PnuC [Woeseia sp.]NNL55746.1 nicotinamide mononucleotide transporter [Woeseia sp.]